MQGVIWSIEETALCFYQNSTGEGYRRLEETLQQLDMVIGEVEIFQKQNGTIVLDGNKMFGHLEDAMAALEQKDVLQLSDILQYEIKPLLEEWHEQYIFAIE